MPLGEGARFAGFTVVRLLGSGGMGEVYLVRPPRLPRYEALKVLRADVSADPDYRQRFERESELAAGLWHPYVVGLHDRGEFEGQLWISMDFVDGPDARALLDERYPGGMPAGAPSSPFGPSPETPPPQGTYPKWRGCDVQPAAG
uniref:non-specific serine/threonine protein kinase n=1 Tax=Mycobacterium riyadhense TaxID=486698 RepID=A0A653EWM9_9MYCO|nr:Serine/threonine-protein kinase PknF [Mycobacterium riyadhense]